MTRPRTLALLTVLMLSSCAGMGRRRLTDTEVASIRVGMTTEQVKLLIGWPWKSVLHPANPERETYRYLVEHKRHDLGTQTVYEDDGSHEERIIRRQYREIELVFVDGKLVGEG